MKILFPVVGVLALASASLAQPVIGAAVNAASNLLPGLPNSAIAQGALFILYGQGLGPVSLVKASSFPLQTGLAGTSVTVSVAGTSVPAIVIYTQATQVAAVLPSSTPAGLGSVTVTYAGRTSVESAITVVRNNIGVFAANQFGSGQAVTSFGDYSYVTPSHAANPGDTVVFWATGLGPYSGDETNAPISTDMIEVPLEVYVGGKLAVVAFRGRNRCCAALDQINVQLPFGVTGCVVPVVMKIGLMVSNTTTIPIAAQARACTPTSPGLSQQALQDSLARDSVSLGGVQLVRTISVSSGFLALGGVTRSDDASASFMKITGRTTEALESLADVPALGSCTVAAFSGPALNAYAMFNVQGLDAGESLGLSGPNGTRTLTRQSMNGLTSYLVKLGDASAGNYLDPGGYTVSSNGGPEVGAFTATLTNPAPLVWTNQVSLSSVNRAEGATVTWTGGDPSGYVQVSGTSVIPGGIAGPAGATFTCSARSGDGTFTIPPAVLLSLPASAFAGGFLIPGSLSVTSVAYGPSFQTLGQTQGLEVGQFSASVANVNTGIAYQ